MDTFSIDEILKAQNVIIPWGKPVELFGKISVADGRWLKSIPLPKRTDLEIVHIPFGTNLFIDRIYDPEPNSPNLNRTKWYHVYTSIGNGFSGWVSGGVNILPDGKYKGPVALDIDCELYLVQPGDNLWDISKKYYNTNGKWGDDPRFYVGAIAYVNKNTDGITIPANLNFRDDEAWEKLSLIVAGTALWIPNKATLLPLKVKVVSSGSWYFDTTHKIYRIVKKFYDWAIEGAGIIAGILRGALLSVYDIFEDALEILKILSKVVYSLFTGQIIVLAKKIYRIISGIVTNAGEILRKLLDDFASKWNNEDSWERGIFRGTVVGYLIGFAIITFLTVGTSALLKAMSKSTRFAKIAAEVAKGIQKIPEIMKVVDSFPSNALAIAGDAGSHFRRKIGFDVETPGVARHPGASVMQSRAIQNPNSPSTSRMTVVNRNTDNRLDRLTKDQESKLKDLTGKFPDEFSTVWEKVLNPYTRNQLNDVRQLIINGDFANARKTARRMYNNYRKRFWGAVFDDKKLKDSIIRTGARIPKRGNTPYFIKPNGKKEYITIDHKIRIMDDPSLAIESSNFQFSLGTENSVFLEFIRNDPNFKNFSEKLNIEIDE